MTELNSKKRVSELWRLGAFGSKLRSWSSPEDVPPILRGGLFSLRCIRPGGKFIPGLSYNNMIALFSREFYICEPAPDHLRIVQGELCRVAGGLNFVASFEPTTLREALLRTDGTVKHIDPQTLWMDDRGRKWCGPRHYLQSITTPESWVEIQDCLELHDDAILEFTVFSECVGDRPNRNHIMWEVRVGY